MILFEFTPFRNITRKREKPSFDTLCVQDREASLDIHSLRSIHRFTFFFFFSFSFIFKHRSLRGTSRKASFRGHHVPDVPLRGLRSRQRSSSRTCMRIIAMSGWLFSAPNVAEKCRSLSRLLLISLEVIMEIYFGIKIHMLSKYNKIQIFGLFDKLIV